MNAAKGEPERNLIRDAIVRLAEAPAAARTEAALQRVEDPSPRTSRFRVTDRLLGFLEAL